MDRMRVGVTMRWRSAGFWTLMLMVSSCTGHIRLTYPAARKYQFDFLDNARTKGPCGMPSGLGGNRTNLQAGSDLEVHWHLSYPHRGGFYVELMDQTYSVKQRYPPQQGAFLGTQDGTALQTTVTLPSETCDNCTLRLIRQATEWGSNYRFWSCADVTIQSAVAPSDQCSGHGTPIVGGGCTCDRLYTGPKCQFKEECLENSDCGVHGMCVDVKATSYPTHQCYCAMGWLGSRCQYQSTVQTKPSDMSVYTKRTLSTQSDITLYHRIVQDEVEVVMKAKTNTWMAVGWRPTGIGRSCQNFPDIGNVNAGTPEGTSEGTAEGTAEGHAEGTSEATAEGHAEGTSEATAEGHAEGTPEGTSEATAEGHAEGTPEGTSEATAEGHAEGTSEATAEGHAEGTPEGTSEATAEGHAEGTSEATAEGHAEGTSEATAEGHAEGTPEGTSEATAEGHAEGTSEATAGHAEGTPEGTSEATAEGHAEGTPEGTSEATAEGHAEGTPEGTSEATAEGHAEGTSEATAEVHAEGTPEGTSEATAEGHAEGTPEGTSEATAEGHAEGTSEATAGHAEGTPEGTSEATAEGHAEGTSEATAEGHAEGTSEGTPEGTSEGTAEGTPEGGSSGLHPMDCTDLIIGSARGSYGRIGDYYTRDRSTPVMDEVLGGRNSLTAGLVWEEGEYTTMLFRRKLKADDLTDHSIENRVTHVIWAHGQQLNTAGRYNHRPASSLETNMANITDFYRPDELKYHGHGGQRGAASLNFHAVDQIAPESCTRGSCPSSKCGLEFSWRYNNVTHLLTFNLSASNVAPNQWIAIGFSDDQYMAGSDVIFGGIGQDGSPFLVDGWLTGRASPEVDQISNAVLISGGHSEGTTTLVFSRPRSTGDPKDLDLAVCRYVFFANDGGTIFGNNAISKHRNTPIISSEKICFGDCAKGTTTVTAPKTTSEQTTKGNTTRGVLTDTTTVEDTVPRPPQQVGYKTPVSIRVPQGEFTEELGDPNSLSFKRLANAFCAQVSLLLRVYLRNTFLDCAVKRFRSGSIIADMELETAHSAGASAQQVKENVTSALMTSVTNQTLQGFGPMEVVSVSTSAPVTDDEPGDDDDKPDDSTLTEVEIIIAAVVSALVFIAIIIGICKFMEIRQSARSSDKRKFFIEGSNSTSSGSGNNSQKNTMSYSEFMTLGAGDIDGKKSGSPLTPTFNNPDYENTEFKHVP
ncbi:hypothetical protein ACOMHN_037268 [Nucella lapillus]